MPVETDPTAATPEAMPPISAGDRSSPCGAPVSPGAAGPVGGAVAWLSAGAAPAGAA